MGGVIRWLTDKIRDRRGYNDAQKARVDNAGVLTASGLIAGEALCGLVIAGVVGSNHQLWHIDVGDFAFSGLDRYGGADLCHDESAAGERWQPG